MKHTESQIKTMNLFQGKELSSKELKKIEGGYGIRDFTKKIREEVKDIMDSIQKNREP